MTVAGAPTVAAFRLHRAFGNERFSYGAVAVLLGVLLWEGAGRSGMIPPVFISSPSAIADAFVRLVSTGELQRHALVSGKEFVIGLTLSLVVGIPFSLLAGWYRRLGWVSDPLIAVLYATPTIALFPLFIIFLGIGLWDKVLLIFLSGFLQLYVAITAGVRATDRRWVRLARSFRASEARVLREIVLPGAVPFVILGIRLAIGRSVVNVVVAELLASEVGLGYVIAYYGNTFRVAEVFVAITCVVVIGVALNQLMLVVEHRFDGWRPALGGR